MSESLAHSQLVCALEEYIKVNILPGTKGVIMKDLQYQYPADLPPLINGFRPDIYVKNISLDKCIIGEAKTREDLERVHTDDQLIAFLSYCSVNGNTSLMLAVPWDMVPLARAIVRRILKNNGIRSPDITILEKLIG